MNAVLGEVFNRGSLTPETINEMVVWGQTAPDFLFAPNTAYDIYNKIFPELGPWESLLHRKAAMLEVERVLMLFESGGNWREGVDTSRRTSTTSENAEAGAWQVSWDNRRLDPSLSEFLKEEGIMDGETFQERMKSDHDVAMTFITLLLRIDMKNFQRINNGPIRKGDERKKTWPDRPKLWRAEESIYPWLSRDAVTEFMEFLLA
jgi:hypothetical protein